MLIKKLEYFYVQHTLFAMGDKRKYIKYSWNNNNNNNNNKNNNDNNNNNNNNNNNTNKNNDKNKNNNTNNMLGQSTKFINEIKTTLLSLWQAFYNCLRPFLQYQRKSRSVL